MALANGEAELRQDLADATIKRHQECLLLLRIRQSFNASVAARRIDALDSNGELDSLALLTKEALRARDDQMEEVMEKQRKLETIRSENTSLEEECRKLEVTNRQAWVNAHGRQKRPRQNKTEGAATTIEQQQEQKQEHQVSEQDKLRKTRTILRRVMVDLIVGSDGILHTDAKLRDIYKSVVD